MGDWEKFCEAHGFANDESAYDKLSDIYHEKPNTRQRYRSPPTKQKQHFGTFDEASAWSKINIGKIFIPSPDGNGYIEK